jgi:hypothetical protein
MARQEEDREDLLKEATALVERAELAVEGFADPVVIGFRGDGCASVYFGPDPAWHFNTNNELRRAYAGGVLYKAERRRMISLERLRTEGEVQLLRTDLDAKSHDLLLAQANDALVRLRERLASFHFRIIGQVPPEGDVTGRICAWLDSLSTPLGVADSPHAR